MKKTVVITGAGRGLGFALTKRHLIMGDEVHAFELDLSDELLILQKYNDRLAVYSCDLRHSSRVREAADEILTAGRPVDRIYNAAGIRDRRADGSLGDNDLDACLEMYDINALGLLRMCKALLPLLGPGSLVVNIADEQGSITSCHASRDYGYRMSKAAANMASKILSNELFAVGARVLCCYPGVIRTALGGEEAAATPDSLSPQEAAAAMTALLEEPFPPDRLFIDTKGRIIAW